MSDAVGLKRSATKWKTPRVKPLDEAAWQAWKAKSRNRERRGRESRMKALTWGLIVALIVVAGLWSQLAPYAFAIRCVLAAGAAGMMLEAFQKREYGFGALFAGLAVLYVLIAPLFSVSGNWQRALVIASALPFFASLASRDLKRVPLA